MKVTFDKDGYVEMLIMKGDLPNSVELPDDDTIDMRYLACYKLGYDGTQLVLDAKKVQRVESNLKAESLIYDLQKQIDNSDFKVLRHTREQALGIPTTLTQEEYLQMEAERESLVRQIREIEDGTQLETDPNVIYQEGYEVRVKKAEEAEAIINTVDNIVPSLEKDVEELKEKTPQTDVIISVEVPKVTDETPIEEGVEDETVVEEQEDVKETTEEATE